MYWQVYLHKTVLAAEWMMMRILERAGEIGPPRGDRRVGHAGPGALPRRRTWTGRASWPTRTYSMAGFCALDDNDVMCCVKAWQQSRGRRALRTVSPG